MSISLGAVTLVLLLFVFFVTIYLLQGQHIYHPREYSETDIDGLQRAGGEEIAFWTDQGRQFAYVIPSESAPAERPVWLCFSGNAGTALDWVSLFAGLTTDKTLLLIDYPGYGLSAGRPSPGNIEEAILGAVDAYLVKTGGSMEKLRPRLRVFGHSIGAASALIAARELGAERGVLLSPFGRMKDLVAQPLRPLLRHRFDNVESLERIVGAGTPFTADVFHGTNDDVIPHSMAVALFEMFPSMIRLHTVDGAGHNDILDIAGGRIVAAMRE